jgi:hypothetical protein
MQQETRVLGNGDAELDEKKEEERSRSIYMHHNQPYPPCLILPNHNMHFCILPKHGPTLVHYSFCSSVSLNEPHDWSHEPM